MLPDMLRRDRERWGMSVGERGLVVVLPVTACHASAMGWIILSGIFFLSAALNANQAFVVDDPTTRIWRGALSVGLLLVAFLFIRKGLKERESRP